ncbi:MAG: DUF4189 domain-containing protein [Pseudomonadota bacterium]
MAGNHGRLTQNKRFKGAQEQNFEWLLYHFQQLLPHLAAHSSFLSGGYTNQNPTLYPMIETLWGAIAEDKSKGLKGRPIGFTRNFKSKDEAQAKALKACQQDGGQKCEVSKTYSNRCVAIADPINDGQKSKILLDFSEDGAKKGALVFCLSENLQPCRIVYSGCSLGY